MKVRIVNNGQPSFNTQVTNAETGEMIEHVTDVNLHITTEHPLPKAEITVRMPQVDVIAEADIKHVCPYCGREQEPES